jgi:hypothetical protein
MSLVTTLVQLLVLHSSKFCRATPFSFFCSWIRLAADVSTIGGGRAYFFGAADSSALGCASGASVSIWDVRKGARKFLVGTCTGIGTAAFFGERAASAVEWRFRLRTSWKPSLSLVCLAWSLEFRRLLSSLSVTVYEPYSALYRGLP